jgi:hypothetical protein
MRGLTRPSTEVVQACLAPCVRVLDFWFGFALHCIALTCAVCVQFHLVLFPDGGRFLPSLFVRAHCMETYPSLLECVHPFL